MNNPFFQNPTSRKASYGMAFVFILIALMGFILILSGPVSKPVANGKSVTAGADSTFAKKTPVSDLSGSIFKVVLVTGVLVLVILFGAKYFKKLNNPFTGMSGGTLRILARQAIGSRQHIMIVVAEKRKYLLGVTDQNINLLSDLGEYTAQDDAAYSRSGQDNFSSLIQRLRKQNDQKV